LRRVSQQKQTAENKATDVGSRRKVAEVVSVESDEEREKKALVISNNLKIPTAPKEEDTKPTTKQEAPVARIVPVEPEEDEEPDIIEVDHHRRRRHPKKEEEEEEMERLEEESEESESEESSWETDESESEDEWTSRRPMIAPKFVRKEERETIKELEQKEKEEQERQKKQEEEKRRRQIESRTMVREQIITERKKELEEAKGVDEDESESSSEDEEAEYEQWKLRELKRIKRDTEERSKWLQEEAELEARRKLTDAEIFRLDADRHKPKARKKWNFLQKYYHAGVFYQDEDDAIINRDTSSATLEDKHDKTILPKVMQVKNFGRAGRTKWTHLVAEDTTYLGDPNAPSFATSGNDLHKRYSGGAGRGDGWNPWNVTHDTRSKFVKSMGGMGPVDDPLRRKRRRTGDL